MGRASQLGVNTSFIELNALSNSAAETIKVLTAVLSCFKLSGTIDPQLSFYSLKPLNATFFIDFISFTVLQPVFWHTEYPTNRTATGEGHLDGSRNSTYPIKNRSHMPVEWVSSTR